MHRTQNKWVDDRNVGKSTNCHRTLLHARCATEWFSEDPSVPAFAAVHAVFFLAHHIMVEEQECTRKEGRSYQLDKTETLVGAPEPLCCVGHGGVVMGGRKGMGGKKEEGRRTLRKEGFFLCHVKTPVECLKKKTKEEAKGGGGKKDWEVEGRRATLRNSPTTFSENTTRWRMCGQTGGSTGGRRAGEHNECGACKVLKQSRWS